MDKEQALWQQFTRTGRVEDYLRYRNAVSAVGGAEGGTDGGGKPAISDDRRTDRPGISDRGGIG